jgi:hypothetical protein
MFNNIGEAGFWMRMKLIYEVFLKEESRSAYLKQITGRTETIVR